MARKQNQSRPGVDGAGIDGNVDKIREILFGGQMRDYEQRFVDLEKRLTKSIEQASATIEKHLEQLNNFTRREVEKLAAQVKAERKARLDEGKNSNREVKQLAQQLETWGAGLEEQIDNESRELRAIVKEQSDNLSGLLEEAYEELGKTIAAETRQLADSKLAHDELAGMLTEVAARLKKAAKRANG